VESQEEAVRLFLSDYQKSVEEVKASPAPAAEVIGELGIVDAALAEKAIPAMHLVSLQGEEMQQAVEGFLGALHETNPESVGGNLPDETFYFK
jgi:NitT/TauT family transport system substrate-binding protein